MPLSTPFPKAPVSLLEKCERSKPVAIDATVGVVLATVTANYSAAHRCADKDDALVDWIKSQEAVR